MLPLQSTIEKVLLCLRNKWRIFEISTTSQLPRALVDNQVDPWWLVGDLTEDSIRKSVWLLKLMLQEIDFAILAFLRQDCADKQFQSNILQTNDILLAHWRILSYSNPELAKVIRDSIAEIEEKATALGSAVEGNTIRTVSSYNLALHLGRGSFVQAFLRLLFAGNFINDGLLSNATYLANESELFIAKAMLLGQLSASICWLPREIWSIYFDVGPFEILQSGGCSLACLNHLILDALEHYEKSLELLGWLHAELLGSTPQAFSAFRYLSRRQLLALSLLVKCYDNPRILEGSTWLASWETEKAILNGETWKSFCRYSGILLRKLWNKCRYEDPTSVKLRVLLTRLLKECKTENVFCERRHIQASFLMTLLIYALSITILGIATRIYFC